MELDENDPDLLPLEKLEQAGKIRIPFPPKKKRMVSRPAMNCTIMSKIPTQKLRQNEHTDVDVEIIPEGIYIYLVYIYEGP